jgi:cell division protein ZapA (FtsZ GTPase activity inhibitor)
MGIETVRVAMLGASFSIQTDESPEYMGAVLGYLSGKVDEVQLVSRVDDPLKAAILAGIYLVDELFRERADTAVRGGLSESAQDEMSAIATRLIARIDRTLEAADAGSGPMQETEDT